MTPTANSNGDGLDPLWTAKRVREFLAVSDRWLRRNIAAARFPKPDYRLGRAMRWRQSTIDGYLEARAVGNGAPMRWPAPGRRERAETGI